METEIDVFAIQCQRAAALPPPINGGEKNSSANPSTSSIEISPRLRQCLPYVCRHIHSHKSRSNQLQSHLNMNTLLHLHLNNSHTQFCFIRSYSYIVQPFMRLFLCSWTTTHHKYTWCPYMSTRKYFDVFPERLCIRLWTFNVANEMSSRYTKGSILITYKHKL